VATAVLIISILQKIKQKSNIIVNMKKINLLVLLAALPLINCLTSCSSDDNATNVGNNPTPIINAVSSGTWRITKLIDSGVVETNDYANYVFNFGANNVLTATNTNTYNAFWSVTNDSNDDDSPSNDLDFNIIFTAPAPNNFIDDLSDDWDILTYSNTKIELIDVSGGNGGTDYLTFEKN
jgi:hypothetical protein